MMKAYICGKITGEPDYRYIFREAALILDLANYIPINPAELPEGMEPQDYMSITIPMLLSADVVALLPNWKDSKGAQIEKALAEYCGKQIIILPRILPREKKPVLINERHNAVSAGSQ